MKNLTKKERESRIIARGEHSGHAHIITGDVEITKKNGDVFIKVNEDSNACLKHLLEKEWIEGNEIWTKEHKDIPLKKGTYKFVQQIEFDPYSSLIQSVRD